MSTQKSTQKLTAAQRDWENREFVEVVQLNILKIATFLNQFDSTVRFKLSNLNEKLNKLERSIDFCEAATKSALDKPSIDS